MPIRLTSDPCEVYLSVKHLVAIGSPFDGISLFGPFDVHEDALEWAELKVKNEDWWIVTTTTVKCDEEGNWVND